jgi:hypothetical protein
MHRKLVTVQLPIVLVHMVRFVTRPFFSSPSPDYAPQNSLDVVPNSVAQVAMAIEEKRTAQHSPPRIGRHPSQSVQGRAFSAPRTQSLKRIRARDEVIQELGQALEQSPRKYSLRHANSNFDYRTPPPNIRYRTMGDSKTADLQNRMRRIRSNDIVVSKPPTLPRVSSTISRQGAESALGFRQAEVREDTELGDLGARGDGPLQQRLERIGDRPYWFSKRKSIEKWKDAASADVGWLKSGNIKDDRDRDGWI